MKSLRLSPESAIEIYHPQQTEETLYRKFLPRNSGEDSGEEQSDSYSDDQFRMYEFKVRMCARSRSHDWTDCPFAHPSEKARRRCPRKNKYSGEMCPDFRRGSCSRGDLCKFAHGVFEFWLHPSRYRTEACKDGVNCHRKNCFFAHTARQLRLFPPEEPAVSPTKHHSSGHCCSYCRCHSSTHYISSPKSTLNVDIDSLSSPTSPPFSPVESGFSPVSRFTGAPNSFSSYQDSMNELMRALALHELMTSMDAMNVNRIKAFNTNSLFVQDCFNGHDDLSGLNRHFTRGQKLYEDNKVIAESSLSGPDLGWVNDLLT